MMSNPSIWAITEGNELCATEATDGNIILTKEEHEDQEINVTGDRPLAMQNETRDLVTNSCRSPNSFHTAVESRTDNLTRSESHDLKTRPGQPKHASCGGSEGRNRSFYSSFYGGNCGNRTNNRVAHFGPRRAGQQTGHHIGRCSLENSEWTSRSWDVSPTPLQRSNLGGSPSATMSQTPQVGQVGISRGVPLLHNGDVNYPLVYVAPTGAISIVLRLGVIIELAVDRTVRVACHDKFAIVTNSRGTASCILHRQARIFQQDSKVYSNFGVASSNEKSAVFGSAGVLFTMSQLNEAYLVSSATLRGTSAIALDRLQFPNLDNDFTLRLFYMDAQIGDQFIPLCNDIVQHARYDHRLDGSLALNLNGVNIRQERNGDVEVNCRPKHIKCSPETAFVHVRTHMVDMAVEKENKAYVKRGVKRVHVSRSGMVVSDGNCITSMDHLGRIVSSA